MLVAMLWVAYLINYADRQAVFSLFPILRIELGFTDMQLGLVGTVFLAVYSLSCPLTGWLADRWRPDVLLPASLVLWSIATLATGLCHSIASLLFWRGMMGLTEGMYFPAALSVIGAVHAGPTRSRAIALHGTAQFAGSVAGGWLGGWIGDAGIWRWGFAGLSLIGVAYAPVVRTGLRDLKPREARTKKGGGALDVFASAPFLALNVLFFAICAILWILYAWLPSLVHERYGLNLARSGFIATSFLQISSAAGILAGGAAGDWIARRLAAGRFYLVAGGMLLCSPIAWILVAAQSLAILKLAAVGFGLTAGVALSNVVASAYDVVPASQYGFAAGALTMVGGAAGGAAMVSVGRWKEALGVEPIVGGVAIGGMLSAVLLAICAARRKNA
jgi:predicted MFS family arabinose efflux permease